MPRRKVVEHGREDLLECGHHLPNPYGNRNRVRHCPECPRLAEPASELARLRAQRAAAIAVLQPAYEDFLDCDPGRIIKHALWALGGPIADG